MTRLWAILVTASLALDLAAARFALLDSSLASSGGTAYSAKFKNDSSLDAVPQNYVPKINDPPLAEKDAFQIPASGALAIPVSSLFQNDRDLENNPLTLSLSQAASAQGGSVSLANNTVTYTPPNPALSGDTFTYTLMDSFGNKATGTVVLFALSATPQLAETRFSGANMIVRFRGFPNAPYFLQARPNIFPSSIWRDYPNESTPLTLTADGAGFVEFSLPNGPGLQFFRAADLTSIQNLLATIQIGGQFSVTMRGAPLLRYKLQHFSNDWLDYPTPAQPLIIRSAADGFMKFFLPTGAPISSYRVTPL